MISCSDFIGNFLVILELKNLSARIGRDDGNDNTLEVMAVKTCRVGMEIIRVECSILLTYTHLQIADHALQNPSRYWLTSKQFTKFS